MPAMYDLLPEAMRSPEATALMLAIGLQESRFEYRRQVKGPARSFFQFELGGVRGVLHHARSRAPIIEAIRALRYSPDDATALYLAIEHQDTLAACFARCLLWTLPGRLPLASEPNIGWHAYLDAWRPGQPREGTWGLNFSLGWAAVLQGRTVPAILKV